MRPTRPSSRADSPTKKPERETAPLPPLVAVGAVIGRIVLWAATLAIITAVSCSMVEAGISDCIDATCRISDGQKTLGTGVVFEVSGGRVFVLTNAHVVQTHRDVYCEFWQAGHISRPIPGQVAEKTQNAECDAAVVILAESHFGDRPPTAIPLAPPDCLVRPGETLVSTGCANGSWATTWRGHANGYVGTDLRFLPPPANGRSGSAIFNAEGTMIVGLLFARDESAGEGMAISRQALYRHMRVACRLQTVQCPGGVCPVPGSDPDRNINLFGRQENYLPSPYPSLPQAESRPLVPVNPVDNQARVDIAALTSRVDHLETSLDTTTADLTATAEGAATLAQGARQTAEEETGRLRGLVDTIKEDGLKSAAMTAIKALATTYGLPIGIALAVIVFLIRKDILDKVRKGDPLMIEKLAAKTPWGWDDRLLERFAGLPRAVAEKTPWEFDDALVERIADRVRAKGGGGSVTK